ncbi:MAG: hypothetical protein IKE52_01560 [Mogibacterium sp.]|nr:hypothetical protein [Mogibacterium sp.]
MHFKKEVYKKISITALLIVVFGMSFTIIRNDILHIINTVVPVRESKDLLLQQKEKIEDFEYFFDSVVNSMPMIDDYSELYGVSFRERKGKYLEIINSTKSDYEFYVAMSAIASDIPSFHTDVIEPSTVNALHCYNSKNLAENRELIAKNKYWESLAISGAAQKTFKKYRVFEYVDGDYIYSPSKSKEEVEENDNQAVELKSINGSSPDEFIKENISIFKLHYDGKHKKPFRYYIVFNCDNGNEVSVEMRTKDGDVAIQKSYVNLLCEMQFIDESMADVVEEFIHEQDSVSYIKINSLTANTGKELNNKMKSLKYDNVIIDMRDNYGGNKELAEKNIYPMLYSEKFKSKSVWYMPITTTNKKVYDNILNRIISNIRITEKSPYSEIGEKIYSATDEHQYEGRIDHNKNVIIITSCGPGSAADRFVSDLKNEELAVLVGNNTGGEGLGFSFMAESMPNSGLIYIYMPCGAQNPDGTDNSVYGTAPNYYVSQSKDDYIKASNTDIHDDYSAFLKNDTIYQWCVDYLKHKTYYVNNK